MKRLKIFLVENNPIDLEMIQYLITEVQPNLVEKFVTAENYDQALAILSGIEKFDLSILDVKLDGNKVFRLIEKFPKNRFGIVTFLSKEAIPGNVTAKVGPIFHIEKPFDKADVANALNGIITQFEKDTSKSNSLKYPPNVKTFGVVIKDQESDEVSTRFIELDLIIGIESTGKEGKETLFHCIDLNNKICSPIRSHESISSVSNRLRLHQFVRCSKWCCINVNYIKHTKANKDHGGTFYVNKWEESGLKEIPYSDVYLEEIKEKVNALKW